MNKLKVLLTLVCTTLVILSLIAFACAPKGAAPPVTKEKVKISILPVFTRTGYYAPSDKDLDDGFEAGVKYNNEVGYIPGVEILAPGYDCGSDAAKSVAAFQMGLGQTPKPVIGFTAFSAGAIAARQLLQDAKLPLLSPSSNPFLHTPGSYNFSCGARFDGEIAAFVDYFLKYKWKESRPPRFAFVNWETAFGHFVTTDNLIKYIKSRGVEYMGAVWIPANCTDATPQMLQLQKWGVDFVNGAHMPPDTDVILKDADRVGLTGKVTWGAGHWLSLPLVINDVGPLANGIIFLQGYPMYDDFEPWMKDLMTEAGTPMTGSLFFGAGIGFSTLCFEAVKIAAAKVGPENVTGVDAYDAIRTMKDFYFPPSWKHSPWDFTQDPVGQHYLLAYEVQNQKIVKVVDEDIYCPNTWRGGPDAPK